MNKEERFIIISILNLLGLIIMLFGAYLFILERDPIFFIVVMLNVIGLGHMLFSRKGPNE